MNAMPYTTARAYPVRIQTDRSTRYLRRSKVNQDLLFDASFDLIVIDTEDVVPDFSKVFTYLVQRDKRQSIGKPRIDSLSIVVRSVIEAIKNDHDIENELMMTALDIVFHGDDRINPTSNYFNVRDLPRIRRLLLTEIVSFGKRVHEKLRDQKMYRNGFFPYHYLGWNGASITVALDDTHKVDRNATR
jgi:hypothetical protein